MILERARALLLLLLLAELAAPAAAQFTHSGSLNWRWDDLTVNSGAGRFRQTDWAQNYLLALGGPLGSPVLGTMKGSFGFSDGTSINQAVNTSIPRQQETTYEIMADLFSPSLRRLMRFSPNYSRSFLHQKGQTSVGSYTRDSTNTSWGIATGLTLPRLPAVSYSRQVNALSVPSDIARVDTKSTSESKDVSYSLFGNVGLSASQQTSKTIDRANSIPPQELDYRRAAVEANYYEPKWIKLQSFYFRGDATQNASNGAVNQKQTTASLAMTTLKLQAGLWQHSLNYWSNFSHDLLKEINAFSQSVGVNSTRVIRGGTVGNSLSLNESPTVPSEAASDAITFNKALFRGYLSTNLGASGGLSRGPNATTRSDGLSGQLNLFPTMPHSGFISARTTGLAVLRGVGGGRRVNTLSLGSNHRLRWSNITTRLDHIQLSDYAAGLTSISDQAQIDASANPAQRLYASCGYNLGMVRTRPGQATSTSQSLRASLDYTPVLGLNLSASVSYSDTGYTTNAAATYHLGKTSLKISYEYRELSTPATFTHLSISLTRLL